LDHINIWINCCCRHSSSSSSSIIFFFRDEELGWMDDRTDDGTDGWKGRPPPDRLRILYKKISTFHITEECLKITCISPWALRSKLFLAQGVVDPSECIVLVLKHGPTTYMFVHFGIMDPHREFSTSAVPRIPGYPYPTPISYQLLWAVTCLPPSINQHPLTLKVFFVIIDCHFVVVSPLCIGSLSDFILFCWLFAFVFSLGCVFLYFHLPCTFDGCFSSLIFIYRVFLLYTKTLTYTNILNLILVPSSVYTYVDS
jgi:hypothetical protein